jgi:hypothetical protein
MDDETLWIVSLALCYLFSCRLWEMILFVLLMLSMIFGIDLCFFVFYIGGVSCCVWMM